MGLFCSSVHLRTDDHVAVAAALDAGARSNVLDAENGWVSVYVDGLVEQQDGPKQIAASLSARFDTDSISFSVHDSDIARYWLHDSGKLIDEYNSWPGYFEGKEPKPTGGDLDALARLCAPGYGLRDLRTILTADLVFADDLITQIAQIVGIAGDRAISDYRDLADADGPGSISVALAEASSQLQPKTLRDYSQDSISLVRAAAHGDVSELARLAELGAPLNEPAPGPLPGSEAMADGSAAMQPEMTPLIAAIVNSQHATATALLDLGADPNALHTLHGSPVHVAAGMGNPELLEIVLARGGDPVAPGMQQQTPLEALAAGRQAFSLISETRQLMDSLGLDSSMLDQVGSHTPTEDAWNRCEEMLRSSGA